MQPNISHLFHHFVYRKSVEEIKVKISAKIKKLETKIAEREKRVADLRKEYDIDDSDLVELLRQARKADRTQLTYKVSMSRVEERTIGAGVVYNLLTENDFIESDRDAVIRLNLILRNLREITEYQNGDGLPPQGFEMTEEDLKYLEF